MDTDDENDDNLSFDEKEYETAMNFNLNAMHVDASTDDLELPVEFSIRLHNNHAQEDEDEEDEEEEEEDEEEEDEDEEDEEEEEDVAIDIDAIFSKPQSQLAVLSTASQSNLSKLSDLLGRSEQLRPHNGDQTALGILDEIASSDNSILGTPLVSSALQSLLILGKTSMLRASIQQLCFLYNSHSFFGKDICSSLLSLFKLHDGPAFSFNFINNPIYSEVSRKISENGYTFSCWINVSKFSRSNRNVFSIFSNNGAGIQIFFLSNKLYARCLPFSTEPTHMPFNMPANKWVSLTFVHSSKSTDSKLSLFINGIFQCRTALAYPDCVDSDSLQIILGGFTGEASSFYLFNEALDHAKVLTVYSAGFNAIPSIHQLFSGPVACFPACASIKNSTRAVLKLLLCHAPIYSTHEFILPGGWSSSSGEYHKQEISHEIKILAYPDHIQSFSSLGGIGFFFSMFSPSFRGRKFNSDAEVALILQILARLIIDPIHSEQLFDMNVSVVQLLILAHVPGTMRTELLLQTTLDLLNTIESIDMSERKEHFMDGFNSLLDSTYWGAGPNPDILITQLVSYIKVLLQNNIDFLDSINVVDVLDSVRVLRNSDFHTSCPIAIPGSVDLSVVSGLLQLLELFSHAGRLTVDDLEAILFLLEDCKHDVLIGKALSSLLRIAKQYPHPFFSFLHSSLGDFRVFLRFLSSQMDDVRLLALRFIQHYLLSFSKPKDPNRDPITSFSNELGPYLAKALATHSLTPSTYIALIETALGVFSLEIPSDTIANLNFDENFIIKHPAILGSIFSLIGSANISLQERVLMDILTLLKTNSSNISVICKQPYWLDWFISALHFDKNKSFDVTNQIVVHLFQAILWHLLNSDSRGWISIDRVFFAFDSLPNSTPMDAYKMKIMILLSLLTRCRRGVNASLLVNLKITLPPTLQLLEHLLFNSEYSFLNSGAEPSEDELLALQRLLEIAILLLSPVERRQDILRLLFRFLKVVLPKCFDHDDLLSTILQYTQEFMCVKLKQNTDKNLRAVRICVLFIGIGLKTIPKEKYEHVQNLLSVIFSKWKSEFHLDSSETPCDYVIRTMPTDTGETEIIVQHENKFLEMFKSRDAKMANLFTGLDDRRHEMTQITISRFQELISSPKANTLDRAKREQLRLSRLRSVNTRKDSERLQIVSSIIKPFIQLLDTREMMLPYCGTKEEDEDLFSMDSEHEMTVEAKLFWKLDRTECSSRKRMLLRRDFNGSSHPKATLVSQSTTKTDKELELPMIAADTIKIEEDVPEIEVDENNIQPLDSIKGDEPYEWTEESKRDVMVDLVRQDPCSLITPTRKIIGILSLSSTHLQFVGEYFVDADNNCINANDSHFSSYSKSGKRRLKNLCWALKDIRQVLPRRYLLRQSGLEIFLLSQINYFFDFPDPSGRSSLYRVLCQLLSLPFELSSARRLYYSGFTQRWQRREVSNFEYLMQLNTLAGRSYNDITQYPVFPWILTDYISKELDLKNPEIYRDLSKPIGALNPSRLEIFLERFSSFEDELIPRFHYGSHYSSAGIALHYLIRLEPFCSLAIQLQNGHFDYPDRLFHSIASAWDLSINNISDVKELIPEFFYLPEFLKNHNGLNLGTKQDGNQVNDVILPPWASSPEEFVRIHREALESDYVSDHIHEWIDLIFGYKQRGSAAVEANNTFFHLTYEGSVDIDSIQDEALKLATEAQIYHFGQTPSQLFKKPHPKRWKSSDCNISKITLPVDIPDYESKVYTIKSAIVPSSVSLTRSNELGLVIVDENASIQVLKIPSEPSSTTALTKVLNVPSIVSAYTLMPSIWKIPGLRSNSIAVTRNGKFIFSGGYIDNTLKCHLLQSGLCLSSSSIENAYITCIALGNDQVQLVTGCSDGCVRLFRVFTSRHEWSRPPLAQPFTSSIPAHQHAITHIAIDSDLGLAVSAVAFDSSCELAFISLRRKSFIRGFVIPPHSISSGPSCASFCLQHLEISPSGHIVILGKNPSSDTKEQLLLLFSPNGEFLCEIHEKRNIMAMTITRKGEFVVLAFGKPNLTLDFLSIHNLSLIQQYVVCSEPSSVISIDVALDERHVVVGNADGAVVFCPIPNSQSFVPLTNYLSMATHTLQSVSDVVHNAVDETKEIAMGTVTAARDAATAVDSSIRGKISGWKKSLTGWF